MRKRSFLLTIPSRYLWSHYHANAIVRHMAFYHVRCGSVMMEVKQELSDSAVELSGDSCSLQYSHYLNGMILVNQVR